MKPIQYSKNSKISSEPWIAPNLAKTHDNRHMVDDGIYSDEISLNYGRNLPQSKYGNDYLSHNSLSKLSNKQEQAINQPR